jgi:hypothetical protein
MIRHSQMAMSQWRTAKAIDAGLDVEARAVAIAACHSGPIVGAS